MKKFCFGLIIFLSMLPAGQGRAYADVQGQILVLHSYHRGLAWNDSIDQGIANVFSRYPDIGIRTEYMDTKRINDAGYYAHLLELYRHKFSGIHFDVVISSDNNALNFLLKHRDELFPGTPVVFCGVNNFDPAMLEGVDGFTGATEEIAVKETLDVALNLNPDLRYVYIFGADTPTYQGNKDMLTEVMPAFDERLEFIFHDDANIQQVKSVLNEAPENSMVLILAFLRDENGDFLSFQDACNIISKSSLVPVFGLWDYLVIVVLTPSFPIYFHPA